MCRIVFVLAIVGLCVNTAAALPGSGTQQEPWRIESLADFDEFAADANYWAGFTRLETDVNLAGRTYSTAVIAPDTNSSQDFFQGTAFTGVFDGDGHNIKGLTINDGLARNDYLGLFGYIDRGEVKNLGLQGGSISGDEDVGGLVGGNDGSVSNSYSTGVVNGACDVGGLVGSNCGGSLSNCHSNGDVNGYSSVGGLVGDNSGSVSNCYSTGDVSGAGNWVGGLVGWNSGSLSNCYATGDVNGEDYVGGLVGANDGWNVPGGAISNCYSTGFVSGGETVGGLVAVNWGSVLYCYYTGWVSGDDEVGGLVGQNWGSLSNCYSTAHVNGTDFVGGLVGDNSGSVSNCYSTAHVNGNDFAGGLVGYNDGSVSNCYSTGDVNGYSSVGGLVGWNAAIWPWPHPPIVGTIKKCYSTGCVNGNGRDVGGLVGKNDATISASFWDRDTQTHGVFRSIGYNSGTATNVVGLPTAQMQTTSTFTDAGWDFVEIWLINEGATYPVLRQEIRSDLNGDGGIDFADFAIFADHWLDGKGY